MAKLQEAAAAEFYSEHKSKPFFKDLIAHVTSDVVVGIEIVAEDAVNKWQKIIGPTDSTKAKAEAPKSLRALYGTDIRANAVHGSDSNGSAKRELDFFFSSSIG